VHRYSPMTRAIQTRFIIYKVRPRFNGEMR
jgi:hypothetical protein